MKKTVLIFLAMLILSGFHSVSYAQEDRLSLPERFSTLIFSDRFDGESGSEHYRFPLINPIFDPLDLSGFPKAHTKDTGWSLLERKTFSGVYDQMMLLDVPASGPVLHGTAVGKSYGLHRDFYLYATLFAADTFPAGAGSCYIYYSDSLRPESHGSHGVLFDPASGIYRVKDEPGVYYEPGHRVYDLTLLKPLEPADFPLSEDVSLTTYAASAFDGDLDAQFLSDQTAMKNYFEMKGTPEVKAYRIEIIRNGFISDLFINGKRTARMVDFITSADGDGKENPNVVSWSYGPILYTGGVSASCAIGDLYIYGIGD